MFSRGRVLGMSAGCRAIVRFGGMFFRLMHYGSFRAVGDSAFRDSD